MKETTEDIREWGFKRYMPNLFNLFGLSNLLVLLAKLINMYSHGCDLLLMIASQDRERERMIGLSDQ